MKIFLSEAPQSALKMLQPAAEFVLANIHEVLCNSPFNALLMALYVFIKHNLHNY